MVRRNVRKQMLINRILPAYRQPLVYSRDNFNAAKGLFSVASFLRTLIKQINTTISRQSSIFYSLFLTMFLRLLLLTYIMKSSSRKHLYFAVNFDKRCSRSQHFIEMLRVILKVNNI